MFGAISKATNSSFQKGMTFCRSIYMKKVMRLLAFIFEQPSYDIYGLLLCITRFEYTTCSQTGPFCSENKLKCQLVWCSCNRELPVYMITWL